MLHKEREYPCNDERLVYTTYDNAVTFKCLRSDLSTVVVVSVKAYVREQDLKNYFFEFGGWFVSEVKPFLNGFQGMDSVRFTVERK